MVNKYQRKIPTLKYELRSFICLYPEFFYPIINLKSSKKQAVNKDTEIVIEGFPRSGNSFSVGAFESAQKRDVKIAHHLHAPAQIVSAARKNIPAIVLIRHPVDAVISMKALDLESSHIRPPKNQNIASLIKSYIQFYQRLIPYQDKYIVSLFEVTTSDFGSIIKRVNQRFDTEFEIFNHIEANTKKVFDQRGFHASPNSRRQEIKKSIREELQSDVMQKLSTKAETVYREFTLIAQRQENHFDC